MLAATFSSSHPNLVILVIQTFDFFESNFPKSITKSNMCVQYTQNVHILHLLIFRNITAFLQCHLPFFIKILRLRLFLFLCFQVDIFNHLVPGGGFVLFYRNFSLDGTHQWYKPPSPSSIPRKVLRQLEFNFMESIKQAAPNLKAVVSEIVIWSPFAFCRKTYYQS